MHRRTQRLLVAAVLSALVAGGHASAAAEIDGVKDGVIEDPKRCRYDPKSLIGSSAGACGSFTDADVNVIRKLWEGPRRDDGSFLWYGLPRGADLNALWTSRGTPLRPAPFGISMDWFRYFLTQDPTFDGNTVTPDTILATRRDPNGAVTRSRPLCQYPQVARYKGSGSTDDAANFSCSSGF